MGSEERDRLYHHAAGVGGTKERCEYRISFGSRYGRAGQPGDDHPFMPGITGDHYVTVVAEDGGQARSIAFRHLGVNWAFDYVQPEDGWDAASWARRAPAGEFVRLTEDTPVAFRPKRTIDVTIVETISYRKTFAEEELGELLGIEEWYVRALDATDLKLAVQGSGVVEEALQRTQNVDSSRWRISVRNEPQSVESTKSL